MTTLAGIQANITANSAGFQQGMTRATNALNQFAASGARANRDLQQQFTQTAAASRQLRGVTQQLGFQIQDIIVQLQAGQAKAIIFAQQFSQIASIFRGPWAAAIAIGIAAIGGLISIFGSSSKAAGDLKSAIDNLNTGFSGHKDSIDEVIVKYRELTEQQQEFQRVSLAIGITEAEKKIQEVGEAAKQSIEDFKGAQEGLTRLFTVFDTKVSVFNPFADVVDPEIFAEVNRLSEALDSGRMLLGEFATGIAQLREEAGTNAPEALIKLDDALRLDVTSATEAEAAVQKFKDQLAALARVSAGTAATLKETLTEFEAFADLNTQFFRQLQSAQREAANEAKRLSTQRRESIAGLTDEVAQTRALAEAQTEGVDAIRLVETAISAQNEIRKLKLADDSREAQQIKELTSALSLEKQARDIAKEASSQASVGASLQAEIRARGQQTEELRVQIELLKIKEKLGNEAAEALEEEVRATESLRTELAQVNAVRGLENTIEQQAILLRYAGEETTEYRVQLELLRLKQSGIEDITPEMRKQVELFAQQQTQLAELSKQEDVFGEALENTADSIQSAFTGAYENIFSGGVDTFGDLAEEIKRIFIRLAAEIAALMTIRPILEPLTGLGAGGIGGLFGAGAAAASINPAAGSLGVATGPGGLLVGGGVTSSLGAPATGIGTGFLGTGLAGRTLFGAGAFGGLGGALLAPMLFGGGPGTTIGGGLGGAGGAIGGALLGSIFPGVGTLLGGLGGGLLGGLGGGFLGSLFGGGGPSGNEVSISGGFGRAGAGGTGAAAKFVVEFDKQMSKLLNDRQLELADAALREAKSVSVKYEKELSEGDKARLAAGRVAPVAGALGFREQAFKGLGAEEALGQLQEALQLERTIEDLTGSVTPFKRAILDLRASFAETESRAKELGISTTGMGRALREQEKQLRDQRDLERSSLRLQLQAIIGTGNASKELAVAIAGIKIQFQELREQAEALGLSTKLVDEAQAVAIQQAREAAQQLEKQRQFERAGLQLQLRAMLGAGNSSRQLALAIAQINLQFLALAESAKELGVSLELVEAARKETIRQTRAASREAERETKRQEEANKAAAKAFIRDFRGGSDLSRQIDQVNEAFRQAIKLADQYGISERGLRDARREQIREIKREQDAERDAARAKRSADRAAAKAFIADFLGSDFERQRDAINATFREAIRLANEYNLSEKGLRETRRESIRELKRQRQAEIDALALSVIEPFKALSDPLRDFTKSLELTLLTPIELYRRAQEDFRETARLAESGDTEAIQRLREEGQFYIEQAGRFGASPAQVEATQEVLRATEGVTQQVDISMREASRGITEEIRKASNRQDDTLKELVDTTKDVVRELKKLRT